MLGGCADFEVRRSGDLPGWRRPCAKGLHRLAAMRTAFSATREVRLAPGTAPDMLAGMVKAETQSLKEHFAGCRR